MKGKIAALIAGIVLGVAGVAGAATTKYWKQTAGGYTCEGTTTGALCVDNYGPYRVALLRGSVTIYTGSSSNPNPVMSCKRYGSPRIACSSLIG